MPKCPLYEHCFQNLYDTSLSENLEMAVDTVERYCDNRFNFCARYIVYKQDVFTPQSLMPNQTREAQKILLYSQMQEAADHIMQRYLP